MRTAAIALVLSLAVLGLSPAFQTLLPSERSCVSWDAAATDPRGPAPSESVQEAVFPREDGLSPGERPNRNETAVRPEPIPDSPPASGSREEELPLPLEADADARREILRSETDPRILGEAISLLLERGELADAEFDALLERLRFEWPEEPEIVSGVLLLFSRRTDRLPMEELLELVTRAPSEEIRILGIELLSNALFPEVTQMLLDLATDSPSAWTRESAVRALANHRATEEVIVRARESILGESDPSVRNAWTLLLSED